MLGLSGGRESVGVAGCGVEMVQPVRRVITYPLKADDCRLARLVVADAAEVQCLDP